MKKGVIWLIIIVVALLCFFLPFSIIRSLYPLKYDSKIIKYAREGELKPSLVAALIYNESRFDPLATSDQKAYGLMQIQPPTAQEVLGKSVNPSQLKDPDLNLKVGTRYLQKLASRYSDSLTVLIAYNLGPTTLDEELKEGRSIEEIGSSYGFAQHVLQDSKIYERIYPELDKERKSLSAWQAWRIIFLGRI